MHKAHNKSLKKRAAAVHIHYMFICFVNSISGEIKIIISHMHDIDYLNYFSKLQVYD